MKQHPPSLRIGTSGYQYDHWRNVFYPEYLPKKRWFEQYSRHFDTVEINNTFYHLPDSATFDHWREQAPPDFIYALKFSRYGSHMKYLKDPESTVGAFMERAGRLGPHLGPVLVQLKPHWSKDLERLRAFLEALPKGQRWSFEFRNPSWLCAEVFDLLRRHNAALCIHDMIRNHPQEVTAGWVYFRFHGDHYRGSYSRQFLSAQACRIAEHLDDGLDVFAYFNNDAEGYAVQNALDLRRYVNCPDPIYQPHLINEYPPHLKR